jgi:Histidine kinase
MIWPFHNKTLANYWLKVFALYALIEACIQLLFFFILNNFGSKRISIIEYHIVMWFFQCLLIWPIWWVAWSVRQRKFLVQVLVNVAFYVGYSYCWFGPMQDAIAWLYNDLQGLTRPESDRQAPYLDRGNEYSFLNYQLLKHAFRLSWFFLAAYFYNYRLEEKKRLELSIANKELQLRLLKWHLNPSFYFKTINHLRQVADEKPINTTGAILQLAKVMEYVIYEAKEKLIDVKKEIQFLNNYIQLINQQPDNNTLFETDVTGDHDKLKIAPLLLAGFIDKMAIGNDAGEKRVCKIQLRFSGNEMELSINGNSGMKKEALLVSDDALHQRLKELYPGRFSVNITNAHFKLCIKLDEER